MNRTPRQGRSRRPAAAAVLALTAALALGACGGPSSGSTAQEVTASREPNGSPYLGTALSRPFTKPDLVLDDTSGKPFPLRERTAGKPVLLFFGYTSCPDVCPTTMGDIAVAMKKLPPAQRDRVEVVFVSTDPQRDTPKTLRTWLDSFDTRFVGLTGDLGKVKAAARTLGILVEDPVVNKDGSVTSSHGAQVLAFLPSDDKAHVLYLSQSSVDVFAHDLPLLAKGVTP
ncbi:SCO family protein [Streptacidiphilus sp. ASG 303]|uniref:SCO family protein n=1 Tax=Streptacidiphilus sp. ASG 303 TaxID=2896847 RepID=UPI001E4D6143|nr:SCO family protein [Streptacidiphilus sp. ASG 303]MCD0482304.1 SCO family protein [Streptacidiphilus sp. ASG 303]